MLDKLLFGGIGRGVRLAVDALLAKLVLIPLIAQVPGSQEFLSNPDLHAYIAVGLTGLLLAGAKTLRDKGLIPAKLPL